jgi:hypothetical protein
LKYDGRPKVKKSPYHPVPEVLAEALEALEGSGEEKREERTQRNTFFYPLILIFKIINLLIKFPIIASKISYFCA